MRRLFEGYSNLEESMKRIHDIQWESGNEAHSKAGYLYKKFLTRAMKRKKTTYTTKVVNGKRQIVKTSRHSIGDRINHKTGQLMSNAPHMSNFIQFRTYSTTGTTVVGGLMKKGYTEIRKNGKITGRARVYSVNQSSVDILEKMSSGRTGKAKWNKEAGGYSPESIDRFEGTHENHPTHFIREGKAQAIPAIKFRIPRWTLAAIKAREDNNQAAIKRKV